MPWFRVRTREVWDATHLVEAATEEGAIQSVVDGRSDGISEFAYLLKDDIECEEAKPPSKGPIARRARRASRGEEASRWQRLASPLSREAS
jgi:hypothetical protein